LLDWLKIGHLNVAAYQESRKQRINFVKNPISQRKSKRKRVYILASISIDKRSIKATEKEREKEKKIEFKQRRRN
jgi:hypothetical protein